MTTEDGTIGKHCVYGKKNGTDLSLCVQALVRCCCLVLHRLGAVGKDKTGVVYRGRTLKVHSCP